MASIQYSYSACDPLGNVQNGQLSADSEQEVLAILQAKNLVPLQIDPAEAEDGGSLFARSGISSDDVVDFTNGLCTLVEAKVPLDRALSLLENLTEKQSVKEMINNLRREVKDGKTLADALKTYPQVFSKMYINMVHAGEEGGILEQLLPRLQQFLQSANEAKRTIISSMIYPMILAVVGILSVILLLIFVVPQFASMFTDMGTAIPDSAAFLLHLSHWLKNYGWSLLFIPPALWYSWRQLDNSPESRLQRDTFLLKLPLLGTLLLQAESSRFCRTLGALLHAGIPLLRALNIVRGVMDNQLLNNNLKKVEESVRSGIGLGQALHNAGGFPLLLSQLVIVGEESGRTNSILEKLAESFDVHVKQQTTRLVSLLEPMLILFLGIMVGSIVIIMLSAIFSINDVQY